MNGHNKNSRTCRFAGLFFRLIPGYKHPHLITGEQIRYEEWIKEETRLDSRTGSRPQKSVALNFTVETALVDGNGQ